MNPWRFVRKAWRWSRTILINFVTTATAIIAAVIPFLASLDWNQILSTRQAFWIMGGLGIINILLRLDTHGSVGSKPEPSE